MGKPINSNAQRVETSILNTKIDRKVLDKFKDCCKEDGYPLNIVLEPFMRQYANGNFKINDDDILNLKDNNVEVDIFSTTLNKEIYSEFKRACKRNGFFIRYVVTAFMERYSSRTLILEYKNIANVDIVKEVD